MGSMESVGRPNRNRDSEIPPQGGATSTGTTIVGICTDEGVILGADQRASLGGRIVTSKQMDKIATIHESAALAITGSVGDNQRLAKILRAESGLYRYRRGQRMPIHAAATAASNLVSGRRMVVAPLIGGVDPSGTHLYSVDGAGGILPHSYTAGGSGMPFALGVLEQQCDQDLNLERAQDIAVEAIGTAMERDTASGNGIRLATIVEDGMTVETFQEDT